MTSEILRFSEKPIVDESIQEYEYHEYEPVARTSLNSAGEININIETRFIYPSFRKLFDFRRSTNKRRWFSLCKYRCGSTDK